MRIILMLLLTSLILTGCLESSEAGTARASSEANQNQMDEMALIVDKLIKQNHELQKQTVDQGINPWLVFAIALIFFLCAMLPWAIILTQRPKPPLPPIQPVEPFLLPETNRYRTIALQKSTGEMIEMNDLLIKQIGANHQ